MNLDIPYNVFQEEAEVTMPPASHQFGAHRPGAPATETLMRRLPPWRWLAVFMAWAIDHLPGAVLRPFMMKFLTTALAPSLSLFEAGALLVNRRGERFGNELERAAWRLPDQPDKLAYIVLDQALAKRFSAWPDFVSTAPGIAYAYIADYRRNRPDVYTEAPTLDALAVKLGMDPRALRQSVAAASVRAFDHGPFIALGPVRSAFAHSEGGLAVDGQHRVLGADGQPLPGLYAAGSTGQGGLLLKGHGHHLAWAFVWGGVPAESRPMLRPRLWPNDALNCPVPCHFET